MKVVILAGGLGTRLSEETRVKPKPMVEIGGQPILWHIMKSYTAYGLNEFIICCGYRGQVIKDYFANYYLRQSNVTFDMKHNRMQTHHTEVEDWSVTLVDTGQDTLKGGRMKRVKDYIGADTFCLTYGDGVSDVDIGRLIAHHLEQKRLATLTAVQPPGRFGTFSLFADNDQIADFREKPTDQAAWVNAGFFVLEPAVLDYIAGDATEWEAEPLQNLAGDGQLTAYRHHGFWHPMDTLRDNQVLEGLWRAGQAPWKNW